MIINKCLYKLKMLNYYRINFSEGIDVDRIIDIITLHQKQFFSSPGISLKPRKD